jgi:hypothetical protein
MKASDAQRLKALRAATGLAPKASALRSPQQVTQLPAVCADLP